jgi:membrane fusion protein (multidrug efflux system)
VADSRPELSAVSIRTRNHTLLRRLACALAVAAVTASGVSGCGGAGGKSWAAGGKDGKDKESLRVATAHVQPANIERYYRTSGTLKAKREAQLVAVQVGVIKAITAEEGDIVEAGQALVKLDGRELALQAAADSLAAQNLARELDRLEKITSAAIAAEEVDKQRYAVEEARVSAKLSRFQAKQTTVRAPFDGTIVERLVDEGNLATTATPLFRIADLSALELELHVPEKDAATVKDDAEVEVELVDGSAFVASIVRRSPVVDPLTGTVKFTVQAEKFPPTAKPGAFARARVLVDAREAAPSIPRTAVFEVEGEPHVYVVAEGKARRSEVKLGLEGTTRVEVLSGLTADDVVVVDGNAGITEGMPLVPDDKSSAADAKEHAS